MPRNYSNKKFDKAVATQFLWVDRSPSDQPKYETQMQAIRTQKRHAWCIVPYFYTSCGRNKKVKGYMPTPHARSSSSHWSAV